MAEDAQLAHWWNKIASPAFAHIRYDFIKHTHSKDNMVRMWRRVWLDAICPDAAACAGWRVVEYGIGAGLLGAHMLSNLSAAHYTGIDVATRQLDYAAKALRRAVHNNVSRFTLLAAKAASSASFSGDLFVCQQVMQHFPSQRYVDDWLRRVNESAASTLMLQTRSPVKMPGCRADDDFCQGLANGGRNATPTGPSKHPAWRAALHTATYGALEVTAATQLSTRYLQERLPRYTLVSKRRTDFAMNRIAHSNPRAFEYHTFMRRRGESL